MEVIKENSHSYLGSESIKAFYHNGESQFGSRDLY